MLGVALKTQLSFGPLNGLRHPPTATTCGWYLWGGLEFSEDPEFFLPIHVFHIPQRVPRAEKYLGLAPGWRFLIDANYEDVWFDANLLIDDEDAPEV